jgi:hypothetical protein
MSAAAMRWPRCSGERRGDEVLQVAHVVEPRGAAVKQVMHEADELLAFGGLQAGHEGMHGLAAVKETLPSGLRDLIGQGGGAFAAIEGVVGIPKRLPSGKVCGLEKGCVYYASDSTLRRFYEGWRLIWLDFYNARASW